MRFPKMERCVSGLNGSPGKTVCQQWHRGFESRPFRNIAILIDIVYTYHCKFSQISYGSYAFIRV